VTNTTTDNDELLNNLRPLTAGLMDRAQAADFLTGYGFRISRSTLAKYAVTGAGRPIQNSVGDRSTQQLTCLPGPTSD
jgi:hypothetical protein